MDRKKIYFLITGVIFGLSICLVGCNAASPSSNTDNKDSSPDLIIRNGQEAEPYDIESYKERLCDGRISIEECAEQYSQDIELVKSADYGNFSFTSCQFEEMPEFEELYVMSEEDHGITTQESWDYLEQWLESIGKRDLVDMEKEVRIVTPDVEWDDTQEFPYSYPALCEHMDLSSGGGAFVTTKDCHMQISYDGAYSMSDGKMNQYLQDESSDASHGALGAYSEDIIEEGPVSELSDKSWPLISGELTVGEGAELVKSYFEAGTPFPIQDGVSLEVPEAYIFTLGDVYGYGYWIQRIYKGMPIAYGYYRSYTPQTYGVPDEDKKEAYVVDREGVSAYCGKNASAVLTEIYADREMLGLSQAVQMMSREMASQVTVQVDKAELVYAPVSFDSFNGNDSNTLFPCWAFYGTNLAKGEKITIYMDVLTGDIYYYTYVSTDIGYDAG